MRKRMKYELDRHKIRALRGSLTTTEAGLALGVSQTQYSKIECAEGYMPEVNTLAALAEMFGVEIIDLLKETGEGTGVTSINELEQPNNAVSHEIEQPRRIMVINENGKITRFIELRSKTEKDNSTGVNKDEN